MLSHFDIIPERVRQTDRQTKLLYQHNASALLCWRALTKSVVNQQMHRTYITDTLFVIPGML